MTNEEQTNRDTLSKSISLVEDITRTTQRIHSVLWNLMSNPEDIDNVVSSIDDLHNKVTTLKGIKINAPLVIKEVTIVPGISEAAPTEDPDYEEIIITPPKVTKDISVGISDPTRFEHTSDSKKIEYEARKKARLEKMKKTEMLQKENLLKKNPQKAKVKKSKKQNMPKKPFSKDLKPQLIQDDK